MLVGVKLLRHWKLGHSQSDGSLHQKQQPHKHLFIALVDGLIGIGICETLVVLSEV